MKRKLKLKLLLIMLLALGGGTFYRAIPLAQAEEAPPAPAVDAVLSMEGPGGRVSLGDTLAQAKKAFPARKGATIGGALLFRDPFSHDNGSVRRDGWSWETMKPRETFEVNLLEGKIAAIVHTIGMTNEKSRKNLIEKTIQKLGKPTSQIKGQTADIYAWAMEPNARILIGYKIAGPTGIFRRTLENRP